MIEIGWKALVLMLLVCVSVSGCGNEYKIIPKPAESWPTFTNDGTWCWFSDPRAIYYKGVREQTYAAWVNSHGDIMIGAYNHEAQTIQTSVLHEKLNRDDHAVPSILLRSDGHLVVFYSKHTGDCIYKRVSLQPEDISQWSEARELHLNINDEYPADLRRTYCYSNPYQLSTEHNRIFLFWRGIGFKPNISISDDGGETWQPGRILVQPKATYRNQRPYVKYYSSGKDRIHIAFTDGHPRNEVTNGIYYACYRDSAFYRADGSHITDLDAIPFGPRDADIVYDARKTNVRAWVWDVAEDEQGYPVIAYTRLPEETDHRYHYVRWNGTQWIDNEIVAAGRWFPQTQEGATEREPHYSGGIALDHLNPNIVFLSRPVDGVFEIERWETSDNGRTWSSQAVTQHSKHDNVRPFVPWNATAGNGPSIMWMNNERYVHYTDYKTSIRMDGKVKRE